MAFHNLVAEKVASGFQFTEGPVWHHEGFLLFSDIPANKIYQLSQGGKVDLYLDKSGLTIPGTSLLSDMVGSNGLAWDHNQQLVLCQHGDHAIAMLDAAKKMQVITGKFKGRPFNSPNDLVISMDGSIYFSDPPYGLKDQVLHAEKFQPVAGIYRYYRGETSLLTSEFHYPNGLCFSPGEEFLYAGSNHPDEPLIRKYTLKNGNISGQSILIRQNADGIKSDDQGRLYLATDEGILIVSPAGDRLALIPLPETPANLAWAGEGYHELYVTARTSIYKIKNINS